MSSKKCSNSQLSGGPPTKSKKYEEGKKLSLPSTNTNDSGNNPKPVPTFKNPNFQHSGAVKSGRKWTWKNLKPIAQAERSLGGPDAALYLNIDSPPSVQPVKKYADVSGQLAKYTDPETGLYYSSTKEYKQVKRLPSDIVQGYLDLRTSYT